MGVLDGLEPQRVFYYFEKICAIPHGSYNVKGISDYLMSVAKSLGLEARQDEEYNVVIRKPKSEGYPSDKVLMLQGHIDMVAVKDEEAGDFDLEKEGVHPVVKEGFVWADHTSLGGDDGIAAAMMLAILEDDKIEHPALECVFTTEEEVGMEGAFALDASDLKASYLLNLDSECEGQMLAGCAGGACVNISLPTNRLMRMGDRYEIKIKGLIGGHSGQEIDKERANANVLMGRFLYELHERVHFDMVSVSGGEKDNAIANCAQAQILTGSGDSLAGTIHEWADSFIREMREEYRISDPDITVEIGDPEPGACWIISPSQAKRILFMMMIAPYGVQNMSLDIPGLVETSLNLGIVKTEEESVTLTWSLRSSVKSRKQLLIDKLSFMADTLGAAYTVTGSYPEWPFNPDSRICKLCCDVYEEQTGKKAEVMTMHAGVECGLLGEKIPGLDMVSIGPNLYDIHTPKEHMEIASVQRSYKLVLEVLKRFAQYCG